MEKLGIFIRVLCQFFVVNGPIFEEIVGGDVEMTFYMMLKCIYYACHIAKLQIARMHIYTGPHCIYSRLICIKTYVHVGLHFCDVRLHKSDAGNPFWIGYISLRIKFGSTTL